jgi:putative spermidine/putrescine transport system substrate-binding protein
MRRAIHSAVAIIAAVSVPATSLAAEMTAVGDGEGEVNIVAWPGYIERGESDKAYDWVTDFEKETGCKVNVKTAATSDEMVTLMNQGGFDLVTASAMPRSPRCGRRCSRSISTLFQAGRRSTTA